jgi:protein-S-isoprenylcysteine O-methyltransferase Ste14
MTIARNPGITITAAWICFLVFWVISSLAAKRIATGEGRAGILRRVISGLVGYVLFFRSDDPRLGVLAAHFLPGALWIAWLGAAITIAGVLFAIWARIYIGKYWSATVALKSGHRLIRSGPYARIRHPIYTGILVGLAGSAIVVNRYAALLAVVIYAAMFWFKARKEERLLAGEFGPAFEEHRRSTGFFLPRLFGAR